MILPVINHGGSRRQFHLGNLSIIEIQVNDISCFEVFDTKTENVLSNADCGEGLWCWVQRYSKEYNKRKK